MKKFEYIETVLVATYELEDSDKYRNLTGQTDRWKEEGILSFKLNQFGAHGWELIHIRKVASTGKKDLYNVIFKREII